MTLLSFISRACLVCLFPPSALDKVMHRKQALEQARSGPLPDASLLIDVGTVVEVVAPLCIVTGRLDRPAAFVLAGFCAVTALGYHQFWTYDDLRAPGKSKGRDEMWEFLKNFGLVGGLLTVAFPKQTRR